MRAEKSNSVGSSYVLGMQIELPKYILLLLQYNNNKPIDYKV